MSFAARLRPTFLGNHAEVVDCAVDNEGQLPAGGWSFAHQVAHIVQVADRRSSHYATRSTLAQSVQCSHRALIDLHNAFLGLHNPSNGRTARPMLTQSAHRPAQRVHRTAQHVHRTAQRIQSSHGALNARTTRSTRAQSVHRSHGRLKSRPRRFPVTAFRLPWGHYP